MHNAYISSTLFSFSLSDYSSSLNRRYDRIPLSSYSCCSCCSCYPCCAFTVHTRVPLNHSYLYGLRQSSFIQCAPSRRVFLGGGDRYFYRFPVYDDVGDIYDVSCSIKKRNGSGGSVDRRKKGRIRCKVSEENFERYKLGGVEDADAVISLLSEEVSEEYLGGREISQRLARKVEVEKREGSDSEFYRGKKNRVEEKRRGSFAGESSSRRTKGVSSNLLESDSKCRFESRRIDSREKAYGRTQEIQAIPRSDNRRGRTNSSSSSSYYSVSSPGEYEFDEEFNNKDRLFVEETSSRRTKDLQREEGRYNAPVREEFYWRGNDDGGYREVPQQRYTGAGAGDGWDCRKKSEKKLTEVPSEEAGYWEQSLQNQSRLDRAHKTDYRKLDPSPKQVDEAKSKSILAEDLDKATSKHYRPIGMERIPPSRYITQEVAEKEDIHGNDARMTFQPQMQFDSREEKQDVVQRQRKVGTIAGNDYLSKKPQQVTRTSDILDGGSEGISNVRRQYATRIPEEDRPLGQSSVVGTDSQYQQSGERFTRQIELRRKPERFSEMSEILDKTGRISSGIQSEYTGKNQRESSRLDPVSYQELKNQQFQKEHEHHSQIQSRKGSEEISTAPMIHASDKKRETESQRSSEKRIINQRNVLTSAMKHLGDEREKQNKANEKAVLTHRSTGLSSAHGKPFGESSNSQASTSQTSHARMHQVDNDARKEERSSEATLMPPPSQFVARGSQEVSGKPSESSSGDFFSPSEWRTTASLDESYDRVRQTEIYAQPLNSVTHEDALRSAHRQEELSAQLVEEFLEKAAQEVSTYALQKADKVSEKVVHEDEKQRNIGLGQYDSEDLRSKGPESRQSPEGSEAKGPSDEMWHVRDPSVQPLVAEASEGNKETKNSIVKKGGRSLWNIVADIARLRWGPRAETPKSAAISDAKSSSNESTSSEAWFSGRESDKNGDDNLKRDKRSKQQEAASSQQQQLGKSFIHTQGELSDTTRSRSNELGPAMPSSGVTEGGSPSNGISSASAEKNIGQKEYITGSSSAMGVGSSLLISRRSTRRSSGIEETSERGQTDATGSSSMQRLEEPLSQNKNAELKQKNIQRNKQVEKDRFDEWEEAYQRESDQQKIDEMFMREALLEAKKAADYWEVPVGAVLVQDGKIIARGYNLVEELRDSTAHAEMICIREASNILRTWRLAETTLYVTLEPCAMCAGAILQARIGTLVWGAPNKLLGADGSWVRLFPEGEEARNVSIPTDKPPAPVHPFHPKMTIRRGILASECADKMQEFFRFRRRKKEKPTSTNPPPSPSPSRLPVSKHNHPSKFLSKMQNIFHILFCL